MTDHLQVSDLLPAAEFNLCLSRVLLAPTAGVTLDEIRGPLLDDLRALAEVLPALDIERIELLSGALATLNDTEELMLSYSRLFLFPPAPAPLNLGFYLDDGVVGQRTSQALVSCYQRYGLGKSQGFHDLPDHLSLNLEWLAWAMALAQEQAEEDQDNRQSLEDLAAVIDRYTLPGVSQLVGRVRREERRKGVSSQWSQLLQLLQCQLADDRQRLMALLPERKQVDREQADSKGASALSGAVNQPPEPDRDNSEPLELVCRSCGRHFTADIAFSTMITRLRDAGLDAAHLEICSSCNGEENRTDALTPPGARRFARRT